MHCDTVCSGRRSINVSNERSNCAVKMGKYVFPNLVTLDPVHVLISQKAAVLIDSTKCYSSRAYFIILWYGRSKYKWKKLRRHETVQKQNFLCLSA